LLITSVTAHGELKWEATEVSDELGPDSASLKATYKFKNTGSTPVRITEIKSSCGCANGATDQSSYEPGASGVFSVTFDGQGAVGPQQRTLTVVTDEKTHSPYTLTLRVNIREWFTLTPRLVMWTANETPTPKTVSVLLAAEAGAHLASATSSSPSLGVKIIPAKTANDAATVEITPATTSSALRATVNVVIKREGSQDVVKTIHVRIR
jgi:hypothetical protein